MKPKHSVAEVLTKHIDSYVDHYGKLTSKQNKVVNHITRKHPVKYVLKWHQPTNHITLFQREYYGAYQTEYRRGISIKRSDTAAILHYT